MENKKIKGFHFYHETEPQEIEIKRIKNRLYDEFIPKPSIIYEKMPSGVNQ